MRPIALLALALLTAACGTVDGGSYVGEVAQSDGERLERFLEEVFLSRLDRSEALRMRAGARRIEAGWEDRSEPRLRVERALLQRELTRLRSDFDRRQLDGQSALSHLLFEVEAVRRLARYEWRGHRYIVRPGDGSHLRVPHTLLRDHPVQNEQDADDYIARLAAAKNLVEDLDREIRQAFDDGYHAPRFAYRRVAEECKELLSGRPFEPDEADGVLLANLRSKLEALPLSGARRQLLLESAEEALVSELGPAYAALVETLEALARETQGDHGAWSLPDGDAFYVHALEDSTTLRQSPATLHQQGLDEVVRIKGEMSAIVARVDHPGGLASFFRFLREDPQFFASNDDAGRSELLELAREVNAAIADRMDEIVLLPPAMPLELVARSSPAEPELRPGGHEEPAVWALDLDDTRELPHYLIPALVYRGGLPGRHLRRALSSSASDQPRFRRYLRIPAWARGWDLYAGGLPRELGLYGEPHAEFGRLADELWAACLLVIDTGVHHEHWTKSFATAWLTANTPHPESACARAVEYVLVHPGEAAAAPVGWMWLRGLREEAETQLGDGFDLRAFHAAVLDAGPVPLDALETRVRSWIRAARRSP